MWQVINNFVKIMPQKYRDAREMVSVAIAGNMTRYPWEQCIDGMQQVFGMPLGLLFVDASFDEGSKATVCEKRNDCYYKECVISQSLDAVAKS